MTAHPMCNQRVTLYRNVDGRVQRKVIRDAFFLTEEGYYYDSHDPGRYFLLVVPGPDIRVQVGDRVMAGVGPMHVDWEAFIPANVSELVEVGRVRVYTQGDRVLHVEAENPWN